MVGTVTSQRAKIEEVRESLGRYCREKLGDPSAIIEFIPTEFFDFFEAVVISPKFKKMPYTERLKAVMDFLRTDPQLPKEALHSVSRILTEEE
jgi:hypothetical protein